MTRAAPTARPMPNQGHREINKSSCHAPTQHHHACKYEERHRNENVFGNGPERDLDQSRPWQFQSKDCGHGSADAEYEKHRQPQSQ